MPENDLSSEHAADLTSEHGFENGSEQAPTVNFDDEPTENSPQLEPLASSNGKRVFIETFGCQMNLLDTELVLDQLREKGYGFADNADDADVVLYNTCSVRDLSEQKVRSRIGVMKEVKKTRKDLVVGMLGCMAERVGDKVQKNNPHVDLVVGPSELDQLPGMLDEVIHGKGNRIALSGHTDRRQKVQELAKSRLETLDRGRFIDPALGEDKSQAYVRITRGCNKFCAFCVVPFTRGEEVHRSADSIVEEVQRLVKAGALEVTLLGQTINHYKNGDTNFAQLLRRVHDEVPDLARLRFLTSYPRDFTDETLDVMASSPRMSRFLHIPLQSGNNKVLKAMNRGYTVEDYRSLIERARERMPEIAIVGDMIVGYPGESDEDFEDSIRILEEIKYKMVYVFKYSPREGTVAQKKLVDDVPWSVKKTRNYRMLQVQKEISEAQHLAMVGKEVDVLVEGSAKIDPSLLPEEEGGPSPTELVQLKTSRDDGVTRLTSRTSQDHIVNFDGKKDLVGKITKVRITRVTGLSLTGEVVE
ncbi:MAG: tRNA (N6-isopentenyl adenosine(37)-C2)-methylthiotransferase MiaB [Deltaproteobacteria bacterium]|nr:tRNA (N6-isopentenyl adenosine(37)-C2)-methylthiotransferase MiaB [Deltaproteobacteria bacterium]